MGVVRRAAPCAAPARVRRPPASRRASRPPDHEERADRGGVARRGRERRRRGERHPRRAQGAGGPARAASAPAWPRAPASGTRASPTAAAGATPSRRSSSPWPPAPAACSAPGPVRAPRYARTPMPISHSPRSAATTRTREDTQFTMGDKRYGESGQESCGNLGITQAAPARRRSGGARDDCRRGAKPPSEVQ